MMFCQSSLSSFIWMTLNAYHEARGESFEGQVAVNHVVLNRAETKGRFGDSPKEVIQKEKQFSWYTEGGSLPAVRDYSALEVAALSVLVACAERVTGKNLNGANHYCRVDIYPAWSTGMNLIGNIGNHKFFKD